MGCDIHLYQEAKIGGKWTSTDHWHVNAEEGLHIPYGGHLYDGRNYRLFAVLANVRNGHGFAGIKTGVPVAPIDEPRGLPHDCCPELKKEVDGWGQDGHSHSWLTLEDLDAYAWDMPRQNHGVVPLKVYRDWKAGTDIEPAEYCGDIRGPAIRIIDEVAAQDIDAAKDEGERIYVQAWWATKIRDDCEDFLKVARPRLQELEGEHGAGNARIVFFFDN